MVRCTCRVETQLRGPSHSEVTQGMLMCPMHRAAPALLEALEGLVTVTPTDIMNAARLGKANAAIALARGGSQ